MASAREVVHTVLRHPLLEEARAAEARGALFRETPTTIVWDGRLVEGTVDLAYETAEGFTVVDFKTDRAEGEQQTTYARQVQVYADAVASLNGRPARRLVDPTVDLAKVETSPLAPSAWVFPLERAPAP